MKEDPDIIKILREEEKLGWLTTSKSKSPYEGLITSGEVLENMPDESITIFKDEGLQKNKDKFRLIFDTVKDIVLFVDKYGKILNVNNKVKDILGFEREEVLGKNFARLGIIRLKELPKIVKLFRNAIRKDEDVFPLLELEIKHKNGTWVSIEVGTTVYKKNGKTIGTVNILRDTTERKKMEVNLQESRKKYYDIVENSYEIIQSVGEDGHFIFVNKNWYDTLGYSKKDLSKLTIFDIIHPERMEYCKKLFNKVVSGKSVCDIETKFVTKTGDTIYVEGNATPNFKNGKFVSTHGFFKDVTERKKAENDIQQSKKEWGKTFNAMSDWIAVVDTKCRILRSNMGVETLFGVRHDKIIGRICCEIAHGSKEHLAGCPFKKMLHSRQRETTELHLPDSDQWLMIAVDPILDKVGNLTGAVHMVQDITERKITEEALRHSEEKYKDIIELAPDGIVTTDMKGKVLSCNTALEKLTGYSNNDIVGKNFTKLPTLRARDFPKYLKILGSIARGHVPKSFEITWLHKDGTLHIGEIHIAVMKIWDKRKNIQIIIRDITERKKAEEVLRESEEKLRIAIAGLNSSVFTQDKNLRFTWAFNPSSGFDKESLLGKTDADLHPPTEVSPVIKMKKRVLKTGVSERCELSLTVGKMGHVFEVIVEPLRNVSGDIVGIIGVSRDVTEHKKAEESLKKSEEKWRSLGENAPNIIMLVDRDMRIEFINHVVPGLAIEDVIGKSIFEYIGPNYHESIRKIVDRVFQTGEGDCYEAIGTGPDGNTSWYETKIGSIKHDGRVTGVIQITSDITERKIAEKEIRNLAKFPSENPNPVMRISRDGVIVYSNEPGLVLLKNRGIDIGKTIPNEFKKLIKEVYESNQNTSMEYTSIGRTYSYALSPVKDGGYVNVYAMDITEKTKAEEKIKKQNIQLKKLDDLKSNFLNITTHELRTPMAAIKGYVQMLLKQTLGELTDEQKKSLEVVLRNTDRLDNLIEDILDISRLESGTMKFIPEKTDISKMIFEATETMKSTADPKNIQIDIISKDKIPELIIDQDRIKQVIMNLVENAIKFSPHDSKVNVRVRKLDNDVLFEIQDYGRGISKSKQKKVFETFYQVDSGMDRKYGGAGLGLPISRGIVLTHGGRMWVESKVGAGSTFRFTLPMRSIVDIESKLKDLNLFGLENNL